MDKTFSTIFANSLLLWYSICRLKRKMCKNISNSLLSVRNLLFKHSISLLGGKHNWTLFNSERKVQLPFCLIFSNKKNGSNKCHNNTFSNYMFPSLVSTEKKYSTVIMLNPPNGKLLSLISESCLLINVNMLLLIMLISSTITVWTL